MCRSCSTWQYEIASDLIERHRQGSRLGYLTGDAFATYEETPRSEKGCQVVKSHDRHPSFADLLKKGRALALYSYRDLRDVTYSMMHKWQASFEDVIEERKLIEMCLLNDEFWSGQPGVLIQRYCAVVANPVAGTEEIAEHLGIRLECGEAAQLASEYSLEANRERANSLRSALEQTGLDLMDPQNSLLSDPRTLVHWNHVRTGEAGSWQATATPPQRIRLAQLCGEWLIARGYEKDYSWVTSYEASETNSGIEQRESLPSQSHLVDVLETFPGLPD
jgi:hypothetical protein